MITAKMIQELRSRTGVGMAKCKEALEATNGDMEAAISNLRKAGIASATKKDSRETREGLIAFAETENALAIVEVNAETDFVVKNDVFQKFLAEVAKEAAVTCPASVEAFSAQKYSQDASLTIDEYRALAIQTIGENIKIQRIAIFKKSNNLSLACYSHMGGKLVTFAEIEGSNELTAVAKDVAMHIAAEAPTYLAPSDVPEDVKKQEEEIAAAQVVGKPDAIRAKIVEGKLNAFYDSVCLLRQKFIKDPSLSIEEYIKKSASGKPVTLKRFLRWKVGEGV